MQWGSLRQHEEGERPGLGGAVGRARHPAVWPALPEVFQGLPADLHYQYLGEKVSTC